MVFAGSTCNVEVTKTVGEWVINKRHDLLKTNILIQKNEVYEFVANYIFSSPSAAAAVVLGRSANGWKEWKYIDGKTLDEVKRQS